MVAVDVIFVSGTISGIILMMARFDLNLIECEQAASVSKASPINVFRYITLSLTKWGVLSAGIL